jgi:thioester reductase-like protein
VQQVLDDERVHEHGDGLLTAYAQSKWVAEQVLSMAAQRGLPVRIYRSSHALPPTTGRATKPNDTYAGVLALAAQVDAVPDWPQARVHGLPVDALCRCWLDDVMQAPACSAVVHLEPSPAPAFVDVLQALITARLGVGQVPTVPFEQWRQRCAQAAARTDDLVRMLFEGAAIENMFGARAFSTRHFESLGWQDRLAGLSAPSYWTQALAHTA